MKKILHNNTAAVAIISGSFIWSLCILLILRSNMLPGVDAYFHLQLADIMANRGLIIKHFSWTCCSVWNNAFFDKDWLFHVYLIPFLSFGKLQGGKIAVLIAVFFSGITWGCLFKYLKIKYIFTALILILLSTETAFMGRLIFCRGHILSILILPLCIIFLIRQRKIPLFLITCIYTLTYTGSWQILFIGLLFDFINFKNSRSFKPRNLMTLWCLAGIVLGLIINPYFPANISGGIIQNIMVMKARWFGISHYTIIQGNELYPMPIYKLVTIFSPVIILNLLTFVKLIKSRTYSEENLMLFFFGLLSIIYLFLTIALLKFTDYYVPLAIVFITLYWQNKVSNLNKYSKIILFSALYPVLSLSFYKSVKQLRKDTFRSEVPYTSSSRWLNHNTTGTDSSLMNPHKLIFTSRWDITPYLFYGSPEFKYIVMLDPYFMYTYSPEKYRMWQKISNGQTLSPALLIMKIFKTNIALVSKSEVQLAKQLTNSPFAKLAYTGKDGEKIFILDLMLRTVP